MVLRLFQKKDCHQISLKPELGAFAVSWSDMTYLKRLQAELTRLGTWFIQPGFLARVKTTSSGKGAQRPAVSHDGLPVL